MNEVAFALVLFALSCYFKRRCFEVVRVAEPEIRLVSAKRSGRLVAVGAEAAL